MVVPTRADLTLGWGLFLMLMLPSRRISPFFFSLFFLFCTVSACEQPLDHSLPIPSAHEEPAETVFAPATLTASEPGWVQSALLDAPEGATRVGLLVDLMSAPELGTETGIQVRGFNAAGTAGPWIGIKSTWVEHPYLVARADFDQTIYGAQMRVPSQHASMIANITFSAVVPDEPAPAGADTLGTQTGALSVEALGFRPRSAWKARKTKCTSYDPKKTKMALHHTFTPLKAYGTYEARLRSIQAYHMDTRGWCDVGYHFLVTADGQVWEGRPIKHRGAHVANHNSGNIGVSLVGCFQSGDCGQMGGTVEPPEVMLKGTASAFGKLAAHYGISINTSTLKPHQKHSGAYTGCPGDRVMARLDDIYAWAKGAPAELDPPAEVDPPTDPDPNPDPPAQPDVEPGRVLGVVWDVSVTAGPNDLGNQRVTTAVISAGGSDLVTVNPGSAFWELKLEPGLHVITVDAPGYVPEMTQIMVTPGSTTWASFGIEPKTVAAPQPATVTVVPTSASSGAALVGAVVHVPGVGAKVTDASGQASFEVPPGQFSVEAYAEGHMKLSALVTASSGQSGWVNMPLPKLPSSAIAAANASLQGVVWDLSVTSSPSGWGNVRLDHAIVLCSCGVATGARDGDAYWSMKLPPGTHTLTAVADGYVVGSKTVSLGSWGSDWGSIGLLKAP